MSQPSLPEKQIGLLVSSKHGTLQRFPVPSPDADEVLVQNVAVASNPKDWKVATNTQIEGSDLAGTIVRLGERVKEFKVGDRVAALTKIATKENKYGAYAQYSCAPAATTFKVPETVTFEDAAALPLAFMTAAIALFKRLGLQEPPKEGGVRSIPNDAPGLLIYGASSSCGSYAVQLAKRAGYFVVGVAGESQDYAKSMGADVVVDYRNRSAKDLENAIMKAFEGHQTGHALDTICTGGSSLLCARVLANTSRGGRGKMTTLLPLTSEEAKDFPAAIRNEPTMVTVAHSEEQEFASRFYRQLSQWIGATPEPGVKLPYPVPFRSNRIKIMPHGLASVDKGLEMLRSNQVHGMKLVYCITDTPDLRK